MRHIRLVLFVLLFIIPVLLISACGLFGANDTNSYKKTKSVEAITVPQQLKLPRGEYTLTVPEVRADAEPLTGDIQLPPQLVALADIEKKVANESAVVESGAGLRQSLKSHATKNQEGTSLLIVDAGVDKVWPNMAPALKELGFDIDDANRGSQIFAIVKELPTLEIEEKKVDPGEEKQIIKEAYQIHLKGLEDKTQITVHNKYGKLEGSALADHLLFQIQERIENPLK